MIVLQNSGEDMAAGEMVPPLAFRPRVLQLAQQRKEAGAAAVARRQALAHKKKREGQGTYEKYYRYRKVDEQSGLDPRLTLMKEEWFAGKDYLDVGCCSGKVPWQIFQQFKPRSVVGVDIDQEMIRLANEKLFFAGKKEGEDYSDRLDFRWEDFVAAAPASSAAAASPPPSAPPEAADAGDSPIAPGGHHAAESYDVISCLSTTKWVHLNGGDAALKQLFARVHALLRPGGCFLLEPQPWASYRKRKRVSERARRNFESIELRPEGFSDYLTGHEGGFAEGHSLGTPTGGEEGYRRPLYRFVKAGGPGAKETTGKVEAGAMEEEKGQRREAEQQVVAEEEEQGEGQQKKRRKRRKKEA